MPHFIDCIEDSNVAKVYCQYGKVDSFIGWPPCRRDSGLLYEDDGVIHADQNLVASEDFTAVAWSIYNYNSNSGLADRIVKAGEIGLVVMYETGDDFVVRSVALNDRPFEANGTHEFKCSLAIEEGDFIGLFIKAGTNFECYGDNFDDNSPADVITFRYRSEAPRPGQNLGSYALTTYADYVLPISVRGEVRAVAYPSTMYVATTNPGPFLFTLNTDAWADANVTDAANGLDANNGTYAYAADGDTGYIYCRQSAGGGSERMTEKIRLSAKQYSSGTITVHTTTEDAVASLAGGQGISTWEELVEIPTDYDDGAGTEEWIVHVGKKVSWFRIKIVGSGAAQRLNQLASFQCYVEHTPASGNPYYEVSVDGNWKRFAPDRVLETTLPTDSSLGGTTIECADVDDQDNFVAGEHVILENVSAGTWERLTVDDPAWTGDDLNVVETHGGYSVGDRVHQQPEVVRAVSVDANDNILAIGPWIGCWGNIDPRLTEYVTQ